MSNTILSPSEFIKKRKQQNQPKQIESSRLVQSPTEFMQKRKKQINKNVFSSTAKTPSFDSSSYKIPESESSNAWKQKLADVDIQIKTLQSADISKVPDAKRADFVYNTQKQLDSLRSTRKQYENEYNTALKNEQNYAKWYGITTNADFADNSVYKPAEKLTDAQLEADGWKKRDNVWKRTKGLSVETYSGENDDVYEYINNPSARSALSSTAISTTGVDAYKMGGYDKMTEDEKRVYNYYFNTKGKAEAEKYLSFLSPKLQTRVKDESVQRAQDVAEEHPGAASVLSIGTNLEAAAAFPTQLMATATGTFEDSPYLTTANEVTGAVRQTVGENIAENVDINIPGLDKNLGQLVYDGLMSIGDMGAAMMIGGAAGGSFKSALSKKVTQIIMSSSAGSNSLVDSKSRGESDFKAIMSGVGSAAIEAITEKYSLDALLKEPQKAGKYFLQNSITGGTEEGASTILNTALDEMLSAIEGSESRIRADINNYMSENNADEKTATTAVMKSWVQDFGADILVGSFTEGVMAVPGTVSAAVNTSRENKVKREGYNAFIRGTETEAEIEDLAENKTIKKDVGTITSFAIKTTVANSPATKQGAMDAMSEQGLTPSEAMSAEIKKNLKSAETGLGEDVLQTIEQLSDKLDTAFASAWYQDGGVVYAREAAGAFVKGVSAGDAISAAALSNKILTENVSDSEANKLIKKAAKLLPASAAVDVDSGTSQERAARVLDAANNYLVNLSERVADVSQDYTGDIVSAINEAGKKTSLQFEGDISTSFSDLLLFGKVNNNLETVLKNERAADALSRILGMHIDGNTDVEYVRRRAKNMISVYRAGEGAQYSAVANLKYIRAKVFEAQLKAANADSADILAGFRNAIYNGQLTEAQAKAIALNDKAFELYAKATAGRLSGQSTTADMINAAGLVAGLNLKGESAPYNNSGVKEVIESDTLVPAGEVGIYEPDTSRVILNKNADPQKKMAYLLAHKLLDSKTVKSSEKDYSYAALIEKAPVEVKQLNKLADKDIGKYKNDKNQFAKDMVKVARNQNNRYNSETETYLYCPDLGENVLISRDSFKHSAARSDELYYNVCYNLPQVLSSSIVINELKPRENTDGSMILLGVLDGVDDIIFVRTIIDKKTWKTENYEVVKAINKQAIKKEDADGINPSQDYTVEGGSQTSSIISIPDLLSIVKNLKLINSVLDIDVLNVLNSERIIDEKITDSLIDKRNNNELSTLIFEYMDDNFYNVDGFIDKAAKKYNLYTLEHRARIGSAALSPENIQIEAAVDFLSNLFTNTSLMEKLVDDDLNLAVEIAERVKASADTFSDKKTKNFANEVYNKLYSFIGIESRRDELEDVLSHRDEEGLPVSAVEGSLNDRLVSFDKEELGLLDRIIRSAKVRKEATARAVVDSGEAIARLGKKLGNEKIYHLYNNVKQATQSVNYMLTEEQTDIYGEYIGESAKDIFEPIMKSKVKYHDFCQYMQLVNNYERWDKDKPVFESVSKEESKRRYENILRINPEFKDYAKKVYKYFDGLLLWQLDSGLISYDQYMDIKKSNPSYVPAFSVDGSEFDRQFYYDSAVVNKGLKRAYGGDSTTMPLLDALTLKTRQIVTEARMNLLCKEMVESLRNKGLLSETPTGFEVSDAAYGEFINHITPTKDIDGYGPLEIDGIYETPKACRKLRESVKSLFNFATGSKNEGNRLVSDYAKEITLSESFNAEDAISLVNKLFDIAIEPNAEADAPYYQYSELRTRLADMKLYVPPETVNEIPDYNSFRKSAMGRLILTTKADNGVSYIDQTYRDLSDTYPELFDADIINTTDQLQKIYEVATQTLKKPDETYLKDFHGEDAENAKRYIVDRIKDYSVLAVKEAAAERKSISEDYEAHKFKMYDTDKNNNFDFENMPDGNSMIFYIDGVRHTASIGRSLFEGIKHVSYSPDAKEAFVSIQKANTLFKKLVTSYNIFFSARNFVRDLQDAIMFSQDARALLKNLPRAYREIANNGEMWRMYKALGGVGSSYFDFGEQMDLAADISAKAGVKKSADKVVNFFEYINQAIEQAPRLAEFISVYEKGDGSYAAKLKALYAAADVTVNFGRSGIFTKFVNSTFVPFLNPGVQGASKFVRMFTERKGLKPWLFLIGKLLALGFGMMAINELINGDDEEYEQLTSHQKQNNILIPIGDGKFIKIPKGRSLSVFSIAAEATVDTIKGEDVDWWGVISTSIGQIAPNNPITDNIAMPVVLASINRTWYGSKIESQADEGRKAEQRYDETTDYISRWIGDMLNISPKKVHYVLDSYSGVLGDYILPILTPKGGGNVLENLGLTAISNFVVDGKASNRISSDYYSLVEKLNQEKNDVELEDTTAAAVSVRFMKSQTDALESLYDEIHEINAGSLSPNEKARKTREVKATISALMLNAMASQKEVYAAAENFESKYAYKKNGAYYDEEGDELTEEAYINIVYREVNRQVFGAEYALQTYNTDTYAKATEAVKNGATYDLYYDAYFDTKSIEGDVDYEKGTIKTGSSRKNKWKYINTMDASREEKAALAQTLLDIDSEKITKANSAGISNYDYIRFICDTGTYKSDDNSTKKQKVLVYINRMNLSTRQKDALYKLAGYSEKTIYDVPWR